MKKLFKNLMLVAVAAMAFVACSQEGNEVNILTKETTFEFTAGFNEDTRSGFGEKEGDAYPSVWNGGESIIAIFSNEDGVIGTAYSSIDDLGEGVESSKTATFTVKYEGSLPDNYSVTFYSGSWYTNYETGEAYYDIRDNQSCTDTSVESSNHLCKTEAIEVVNGEISTLNLTFNTATAFGKVTMEQFSEVTDKIEEVKVTINDNTTYTVTPETLTKPVVWFACEAIESVTSLIVEAKVDGVTYIKTKEGIAEGALSFNTGRIRPINVKDMTEKPADYNVVLTKVTKIDGNTISFAGENSNDRLTLVFNPGLEAIVAGTYIGVDAEYGPGFSSDSALEFNYNGSTFNISAAYNELYDYYMDEKSSIVITDLGDNNFRIASTTPCWISNVKKTVKFTFEGKLEADSNTGGGEDPEQPAGIVFTSSSLEASSGFGDFYINFSDDADLKLRLNFYNCQEADKNFLPEGTYNVKAGGSGIYYDASKTYTYAEKDGAKAIILEGAVVVSESNGAYKFEFDLVTDNFGAIKGTYEGAIEGLILPSEYVEPEPEQPTDVTELTISSHSTIYGGTPGAGEHEIIFCYDQANSLFVDIDFLASPITAGTYTLDNAGLSGMYCKSHGGPITDITVVVTDNGGGNLTFDATFKAGDGNWYHFNYTAQIYS